MVNQEVMRIMHYQGNYSRNGDKYICGVDKQVHTILGGIPFYSIDGVAAAGTLHSQEVVMIVNVNLSF
jgi:hypothetical protein